MPVRRGVLLINLGTPDASDVRSVRAYLKTFLSDPRVVDLPFVFRYLLLYFFILPFRPKSSARAYQKIWMKEGSPLRVYSERLVTALSNVLGSEYHVVLGMRYGLPSIEEAYDSLLALNLEHITVLPLFPQYASASTGSAIEAFMKVVSQRKIMTSLRIQHAFYDDQLYLEAQASVIEKVLPDFKIDGFLLMSYHGLPEKQLDHAEYTQCCDRSGSCLPMTRARQSCYRAQCYATAQSLAKCLNLRDDQYAVSFQSRLGKTPWIKPYTDEILSDLYAKGVRDLYVVSPSFVADCLETLEEIGMGLSKQWLDLGGKSFSLIPAMNDDVRWVKALAQMVHQGAQEE